MSENTLAIALSLFYVLEDDERIPATVENYKRLGETHDFHKPIYSQTGCGYSWPRSHEPSELIAIYRPSRNEWDEYFSKPK